MMGMQLLLPLLLVTSVSSLHFAPLTINAGSTRVKRANTADEPNTQWNMTTVDKLKRDLMRNYDKFVRPALEKNATDVKFDPNINHIELDESTSILSIHCWVKMFWVDEKLKWDEKSYDGMKNIHLPDHEIWQPDVIPYNSAAGSAIDQYGNTQAIVYSSGSIIWVPPAILKVFCELDLRKWPFDTQVCMLKVGSWTYSSMEINLNYSDTEPEFDSMIKNSEWQLVSTKRYRNVKYYACCEEPYVDLVFNMTIARRSPIFKSLIITPITAIVFMTLATFWLPAASNEKITLASATSLIISLFLLYFTQKIDVMAGHTPYIVSFYASSLYLVAFSVVFSVMVINLATSRHSAVPSIIKNYLTGWLGRILFLSSVQSTSRSGDDDNSPVIDGEGGGPSGRPGDHKGDWLLLATAIDRILFLSYCFIFICYALAYLT